MELPSNPMTASNQPSPNSILAFMAACPSATHHSKPTILVAKTIQVVSHRGLARRQHGQAPPRIHHRAASNLRRWHYLSIAPDIRGGTILSRWHYLANFKCSYNNFLAGLALRAGTAARMHAMCEEAPTKKTASRHECAPAEVQEYLLKAHWCLLKDRVAVLAAVGALQRVGLNIATKALPDTPPHSSKHRIDEKRNTAKVLAA